MGSTIRILHLENNPNDHELVRTLLAQDALPSELVRAENRNEYVAALMQGGWGIVLSDFLLKDLDGLTALALSKEHCPDVPFIFVSSVMGEEAAIESLKAGATDYLLKNNLPRLAHAIGRALREAEEKKERRKAEAGKARLEEQLRQSQKMEAVGQLAGGIAHDFNNMLTIINGYCELLSLSMPPDDPQRANVKEIKCAGDRAAALTRQLLAFSRRQVLEPKVLDLNAVVNNLYKMLQRLIGENIRLATALQPDLDHVKVDPGQIEQIIMNLVVNARDAMPQGGQITIETANVTLDETYTQLQYHVEKGPYVMLAVSDTGCGMDKATQARIFEPFFTTKELGQGTGLGLSTVYGIVKQSKGYIWVYSEVGRGTMFKVYLPRVEGEAITHAPGVVSGGQLEGSEQILIVEDDQALRELIRSMLMRNGYSVLAENSADAALQICERPESPIRLLITDVVMPGLSGPDLAKRLAAVNPGTRVLYMSGYTDDAIVRHGILKQGANFLQKPFTTEVFLRKVREVLDRK